MKKPRPGPDPEVSRLADVFFSGRVPTVPPELAAPVFAEMARRVVTPTGIRATAALHDLIEFTSDPQLRGEASHAMYYIMVAWARSGERFRFPIPKAADRPTEFTLAQLIATGAPLNQQEREFLFPAVGPEGCHHRDDDWGFTNYQPANNDWREWRMPEDWLTDEEAKNLAMAFCRQMVAEAEAAGRPPLIGQFVMKPPDYLPILRNMGTEHIRLIIRPTGIWCSYITPAGEFGAVWWSPRREGAITLPGRIVWATRVFLACLWRDATVVKDKGVFRVKDPGSRRDRATVGDKPPRERVVSLPRSVRTMEWSDEEFDTYYDGQGRAAHNIRAHYRKLPETWRASGDAAQMAEQFGYPPPPDGYTFVRAYSVGNAPAAPPPRVVARGLQVAGVALAKL